MKKQFLLLAGTAVLFASCGSNENKTPSQAQVDSTVNAKLQEHDAAGAAKNDSIINAKAKQEAEAMAKEKEKKGGGHSKSTPASPAPAPTPTVAPAPAPGGLRGHSDQTQSGATNTSAKPSGGGLRSHSDQNQGK